MAQEHSRIHSGQEMGECPQVKEALVGAEGAIHLVAMDYLRQLVEEAVFEHRP